MSDCFYEEGLSFTCARCSGCCRKTPGVVLLSRPELDALAQWAGVMAWQFAKMYCRWVMADDGTQYLSLREKQNYDCILWGDGGCMAYEARPVQCRTFPFWTAVLQSRQSWDARGAACPGINHGAVHSAQEIGAALAQYQGRALITREQFETLKSVL